MNLPSVMAVPGGSEGRGAAWVRWRYPHLLVLLMLAGTVAGVGTEAGSREMARDSFFIVETFDGEPLQQFTHLTVDKNTGMVYVGGVNRLYQLDPNLRQLQEVVTGPVNDSLECLASASTMKVTNNVNKVLIIDYTRSRLIVCGTVRQGSCQVRDLQNITIHIRNVFKAIVANNAIASTVAFIAPGPPNPPVTNVLYIGVTYTDESICHDKVPAVASRSLEDDRFFEIAVTDIITSTSMMVNSLARKHYPITYVYGFGSEKFSYFLTRQLEDINMGSSYISKLVRVCQNDSTYYSYTEIPIECKDYQGKRYNLAQAAYIGKPGIDLATQLGIQTNDDVLFAVFSPSDPSETEGSARPADASALCVYSMKSVRRMFINNIQECFRGKVNRGLDFISPAHHCLEIRIKDLNEDFCGMDVNTPFGGEQPVEGLAILTFPTQLTAVVTTSTEINTVVFLGTAHGHLKKVMIENQNNALEYDDIVVDQGSAVRQDMFFDKGGDHLYVMTSNKVSKVKTQECSIYEGCNQCLGARDPYCGWCLLENKCSLRRDCHNATQDLQHWVSYKTGLCTTIIQVMPDKLQLRTAMTLSLWIDNLPLMESSLQCVFSAMNKKLTTDAKRTSRGVSCTTPWNYMLPDIPRKQHHFTAKLSVHKSEGPEFVSTNFTFFDCNTYSSCTECVSSPFPCDWCIDGHRCTHNSAENCLNDVLVNGISRMGPSIRSGPAFCPRITFVDSKEILVSSGTFKYIKVKVDNIMQFIAHTRFVCQFNIEDRVTSVRANLLSDTLYCDPMEFAYTTAAPSTNVTFAVISGGSKPLDNPDNIHVLVYQCHLMADNCGMCMILPEKYQCGWCQSTSRCEVKNKCDGSSWLDHERTCPIINVTDFYPRNGPWDGGTNVTIEGINLGKDIDDIYEGITVAGITCQPYRESYVKTKKVTCMVDSPGVYDFKEGPIVVKVKGVDRIKDSDQLVKREYRGESIEKYKFVHPEITDLTPSSGPMSGGTLLHIIGRHMNAGSHIEAFISDRPCKIQSTNTTVATCITSAAPTERKGKIAMTFDNGRRQLEEKFFTYTEDPKIYSVKSGRAGQAGLHKDLRGILSGGTIITVDGTYFDVIKDPKIYVLYKGEEFSSPCEIKNSTLMECRSPAITASASERIEHENGMLLDYGFLMDHVESVRDLNKGSTDFSPFQVFPDPVYHPFEDTDRIKHYKSDYLIINGVNLNKASQEIDVEVMIGAESCNVTILSRSHLFCRPPREQPEPLDGDDLPQVVVKVGNKLLYKIGFLKYVSCT